MTRAARRAHVGQKHTGLAFKLALAFIGLVSLVLIANGAVNMWLSYDEARRAAVEVQREKAQAAAERIEQFVIEVERQIGWTTHAQWSAGSVDQRRYDFVRLLRQIPAITELVQIDGAGKEQLKVSRLSMDVVASGVDYSSDPRFTMPTGEHAWFSPVYFRKESEPYMTISVAHAGRKPGVTSAEVNLKFIWDVVSTIKVGKSGYAYVVDRRGRLIAHPDISLVLRDTDLSHLPQVSVALAAIESGKPEPSSFAIATGPQGGTVLTANAIIPKFDWLVFVDLPASEAMAPVYASLTQTGAILAVGLVLAAIAGTMLARRMTVPIRRLQAGAEMLGSGQFDHRIEIHTGDEIETLADRFNQMAAQLQQSYETLESQVKARTRELSEALEQQTATSEVLRVVSSSPGELTPVFEILAENAARLSAADRALIFRFNGTVLRLAASYNASQELKDYAEQNPIAPGRHTVSARAAFERRTVQVADAQSDPEYSYALFDVDPIRTVLAVPMLKGNELMGVITIWKLEVKTFTEKQVALIETFADQAVIAIENTRLLTELRERSAELARSVEELKTLSEVGQAVSSTLDLNTVLTTIVARAVELAGADSGSIFRYRKTDGEFRLDTAYGVADDVAAAIRGVHIRETETVAIGRAVRERRPIELPDIGAAPNFPLRDISYAAGYRSAMIVPLIGPDRVFGVLAIYRKKPGTFAEGTVSLLQAFASQSTLAIQNARMFREIEEQGRQLAIASEHKSQFLANMSHELRTPLNAVLGYAELLVDGIYGELTEKARGVLERIQSNGKHLLQLINDVLDLSKIEAGQLTLSLEEYAMPAVIHAVVAATDSLAHQKGLTLRVSIAEGMPHGRGDERRLTQVLLNLVGNAIKFTDVGSVEIRAKGENGIFELAVQDTGPGIAENDQARIFEEFQQVDSTSTRRKGGTGLGLAISKRIIEMHGGRIFVQSELGAGSTFRISLPIRVESQMEAA